MVEKSLSDKKSIESILQKRGLLTPEQVSDLKVEQINFGRPIEELIEERKLVEPKELAEARADLLGVSYVDLTDLDIPMEVLSLVPQRTASQFIVIPFKKEADSLSVAMADPMDLQVVEFLEKKTKMKIKSFVSEKEAIERAIERQYQKTLGEEVVTEALEEVKAPLKVEEARELEKEPEMLRKFPVGEVVSSILKFAARSRASDVHVEPTEEKTRVRYRIDGVLQERLPLPKELHASVVTRIKILSRLKIDETRIPQDGRFKIEYEDRQIDLRIATMPTSLGEKVAIRLLEETAEIPPFPDLGLRGVSIKRMEEALRRPTGIVYITGPTGSGKTLTLASALSKINTPKVNIITIEDPVEVRISGVNQTQINPTAGLTFANGLRSMLRQDPDIIMVGETRDNETASLSVHAALTGHLVFSTLHTNSAAGALPRLIDMEIEPFLLTSTVVAVEAQRLVRKICTECKGEWGNRLKKVYALFMKKFPKQRRRENSFCFEVAQKGGNVRNAEGVIILVELVSLRY
jgi:type IV pilus assembly protein PilB